MIYGFASLSVMYPIFDENHILIGFLPNLILYLYLFLNEKELNAKVIKNFQITFEIGIAILTILNVLNLIDLRNNKDYLHYQYIKMDDGTKEELSNIDALIEEYPNTYIIDTTGVFYMIPIERFNGILDLVNVRKFGKRRGKFFNP
ncbi:MAG: hypothetical protein IJ629_00030 [Clostridia bacterium]|nr:hypothetical protein [Clostridia bacterium]